MTLLNIDGSYSSDYKYEPINSAKQHIVVYSGGCDSSLILYEVAKEFGTKKKPVIALSYNHYAPDYRKIKVEKATRRKFKKYCKENKIYVDFVEIDTKMNTNRGCYAKSFDADFDGIAQPYLWLGGLGTLLMGKSNIYFGYIKHDDFWSFKTEFIEAFKAIQKIIMSDNKLFFPYMWTKKETIIEKLKDEGIYEYTWHCETPTPNNEPCGKCTPCKKHKEALLNIESHKKEDEDSDKEECIKEEESNEELIKERERV